MTPQEIGADLAKKKEDPLMKQVNVIPNQKSKVAEAILGKSTGEHLLGKAHFKKGVMLTDSPVGKVNVHITAPGILRNAANDIGNRASERDTTDERSMAKTVKAFNIMYDKDLTETEGWQFMVFLKLARGAQGDFRLDDYTDQASYSALAGESACTSK